MAPAFSLLRKCVRIKTCASLVKILPVGIIAHKLPGPSTVWPTGSSTFCNDYFKNASTSLLQSFHPPLSVPAHELAFYSQRKQKPSRTTPIISPRSMERHPAPAPHALGPAPGTRVSGAACTHLFFPRLLHGPLLAVKQAQSVTLRSGSICVWPPVPIPPSVRVVLVGCGCFEGESLGQASLSF